jgi:hypothetical protein
MILWPGTSAYDEKASTLALSPAAAHSILLDKTATHPDRFVDRTPIFLLGDQYFLTEPRKTEIRLQGFYVDGTTGRIEYRVSDKTVKRGSKHLPVDAFESIAIISEP